MSIPALHQALEHAALTHPLFDALVTYRPDLQAEQTAALATSHGIEPAELAALAPPGVPALTQLRRIGQCYKLHTEPSAECPAALAGLPRWAVTVWGYPRTDRATWRQFEGWCGQAAAVLCPSSIAALPAALGHLAEQSSDKLTLALQTWRDGTPWTINWVPAGPDATWWVARIRNVLGQLAEALRAATVSPQPKTHSKRSTTRSDARAKLIAALTRHHQYSDGACLTYTPIGCNELAKLAAVAPSTASAFFSDQFGGYT